MNGKSVEIGARREGNHSQVEYLARISDKVSRAGRSRFQASFAWMRPRSETLERHCMREPYTRLHGRIPGNRGPCSSLRRVRQLSALLFSELVTQDTNISSEQVGSGIADRLEAGCGN